jgi:hypothetical protein
LPASSSDWLRSSHRAALLELLFVAEILRHLWGKKMVEVLKPLVDEAGYDVALECNGVLRHIQLKSSRIAVKPAREPQKQILNLHLASKPNGCVVWVRFDDSFDPKEFSYLWYGAEPGRGFPATDSLRVAKNPRANAQGVKHERTGLRVVPRRTFTQLASLEELVQSLFGRDTSLAISSRVQII